MPTKETEAEINARLNEQLERDAHSNAMYLAGGYDMCRRLLRSPRFNKPQRELIEEQAHDWKERAEHQGLKFDGEIEATHA